MKYNELVSNDQGSCSDCQEGKQLSFLFFSCQIIVISFDCTPQNFIFIFSRDTANTFQHFTFVSIHSQSESNVSWIINLRSSRFCQHVHLLSVRHLLHFYYILCLTKSQVSNLYITISTYQY